LSQYSSRNWTIDECLALGRSGGMGERSVILKILGNLDGGIGDRDSTEFDKCIQLL
jgi:hypothetical protein